MARPRTQYKLIGRHIKGTRTAYYTLLSENGETAQYTEEQLVYLVGRQQVINLDAQLYKDKVLFRGVGCDIRNLPVQKLPDDEHETNKQITRQKLQRAVEQPKQSKQPKQSAQDILEYVYTTIDKALASKYKFVEHFGIDKQITKDKLLITLYEDRSYIDEQKVVTHFCVSVNNNNIVLLNSNNETIYSSNVQSKSEFIKFLFSCLCIVNTESKISKATDYTESIFDAFNDYSGASNFIDDVLRKTGTQYCDPEIAPYSMLHAALMLLAYKSKEINYQGYLFRGERGEYAKSHIEQGMTSLTYSLNVARDFSDNNPNSKILAFRDIDLGNLVEIGEGAVAVENGSPSEYEVLLRPGVEIKVLQKVGEYSNIPIHLATAKPINTRGDELKYILETFVNTYNTDCILGLSYILANINKLRSIDIIGLDECIIVTKAGVKLSLSLKDKDFILNGDIWHNSKIWGIVNYKLRGSA